MSSLPNNWQLLPLGEIGRWFGGGTPSKANPRFWTGGNIPWVSPKDMKRDLITDAQDHITQDAVDNSATNLVKPGSVLVVVRSGILIHTLPVAIAEREVALNQDLKAVLPRKDVSSRYVALALKAFERDILHTCAKTGTTVQNLEIPAFLRFKIPIAPFDEQLRIVAEIEKQFTRLEAGVVGLRRVQANLKRYRAAVLKAACEGKLVPTEAELARQEGRTYETGAQLLERILTERRTKWSGKGKYKEPCTPNTETLPKLIDGWAWCLTDALFSFVTSGSRGWARYYSDEGALFLRIGNLDHGSIRLDLKDLQCVDPPKGAEGSRTKVEPGDFLISITADVGMVALAHDGLGEAYINQHVALARPVRGFSLEYLAWYLAAEHCGQKEFLRLQRGATKVGLGLDDIRSVPVPLPPLAEQKRIVAEVEQRLSVVEDLETVANVNFQRAARLRKSILRRAFEGRLIGSKGSIDEKTRKQA